jgi:hypothetical protein
MNFVSLALSLLSIAAPQTAVAQTQAQQVCTLSYSVTTTRMGTFRPHTYYVVPEHVLGTFSLSDSGSQLRDVHSQLVYCQHPGHQDLSATSSKNCTDFPGLEVWGNYENVEAYEISRGTLSRLIAQAHLYDTTAAADFAANTSGSSVFIIRHTNAHQATLSWNIRSAYTTEGERLWPNLDDERNIEEVASIFARPSRATLKVTCGN